MAPQYLQSVNDETVLFPGNVLSFTGRGSVKSPEILFEVIHTWLVELNGSIVVAEFRIFVHFAGFLAFQHDLSE